MDYRRHFFFLKKNPPYQGKSKLYFKKRGRLAFLCKSLWNGKIFTFHNIPYLIKVEHFFSTFLCSLHLNLKKGELPLPSVIIFVAFLSHCPTYLSIIVPWNLLYEFQCLEWILVLTMPFLEGKHLLVWDNFWLIVLRQ